MKYVVLALRLYLGLIIVWAITSWIPGVSGSQFHNTIGIPVLPLVRLTSFIAIGPLGFGLIIPFVLISLLASWLEKRFVKDDYENRPDVPDPSPQNSNRGGGDY